MNLSLCDYIFFVVCIFEKPNAFFFSFCWFLFSYLYFFLKSFTGLVN